MAKQGGYKPAGGRPGAESTVGCALPTLDRIVRCGDDTEATWEMTRGDKTVRVSQDALQNQARFRSAWHIATGEQVRVKQSEWDAALVDWWARAEVAEAPGIDSTVWGALEDFCTDSCAMDVDEILNGLPFTDDKENITWFRESDFRKYLITMRITTTMQRAWSAIRIQVKPVKKSLTVKGKRMRVWGVPAFDQQIEEFDIPKIHGEEDF